MPRLKNPINQFHINRNALIKLMKHFEFRGNPKESELKFLVIKNWLDYACDNFMFPCNVSHYINPFSKIIIVAKKSEPNFCDYADERIFVIRSLIRWRGEYVSDYSYFWRAIRRPRFEFLYETFLRELKIAIIDIERISDGKNCNK